MKKFEYTVTGDQSDGDMTRYKFHFDNGFGASVIRGKYSYGGDKGLWELAVLKGDCLCYKTPITDNVIGYLNDVEVAILLDRIKQLPEGSN